MKRLSPLALALLIGCSTPAERHIPPPPEPAPRHCAASAGLTESQPEPDRPRGVYSQRDVALYLVDLHAWGTTGWARVEAIAQDSRDCLNGSRKEPR